MDNELNKDNNNKINSDKIFKILDLKIKKFYINFLFIISNEAKKHLIDLLIEKKDYNTTFLVLVKNIMTFTIVYVKGVVDIIDENSKNSNNCYGFVRIKEFGYAHSPCDVYISQIKINKFGLKTGDIIDTSVKIGKESDRYLVIDEVLEINEIKASKHEKIFRPTFDWLKPIHPFQKFTLEVPKEKILLDNRYKLNLISRIVDLISPIGKGQRGLIVAPPKSGKTIIIKSIAYSIISNHPEAYCFILLIDERPEEVTEMQRFVNNHGEVIASSFDDYASKHIYLSELTLERAKRLVERGKDVVILMDSLTRLTRAYNLNSPSSGKVLSGGVDSNALNKPKRFFGAARKCENSGSLTIIATALIDTGSKMDDVIFEEFKGTGNLEIVLDRNTADAKVFPAIDLVKSGTRRDEYLIEETTLKKIWSLKHAFAVHSISNLESMKKFIKKLENVPSNKSFLDCINI